MMQQPKRKQLQAFQGSLKADYLRHVPIDTLVARITSFTDDLLLTLWQHFQLSTHPGLCLIAVGGYGRQELQPYSDIDILILSKATLSESLQGNIELFIQNLWDLGLEVSQSVRTLIECIQVAEGDLTIMSNLMEARLLAGDEGLFAEFEVAHDVQHLWTSTEFFQAKYQEQLQRYAKFDGTSYNLEPDVKSGPGGLRDIHTIGWVAKRHFNAKKLHDLVAHGFLTEDEYAQLQAGQHFLWRVSFALHFYYDKRESRLLFESMAEIALIFGFNTEDKNKRIQEFMRSYFRTIKTLRQFNDLLLQHFREAVLELDDSTVNVITEHFQTRNNYIEVRQETFFKECPSALLEIFLVMAQHPHIQGVRASTIRLLQIHADLIDEHFRDTVYHKELFIRLLRQSSNIYEQFQRLNRYGLLARYLPPFAEIVGQMQYDLFHVYTVDQHIIFLLRNLVRFTSSDYHDQFPLCSAVMQTISKPEILYIAALFHDIAKGRGGDHSEEGANDALAFCQHHGLSDEDTQLITWLVANHLTMSQTAQRKDIYDPETIQHFSDEVIDQTHLDYLYLLTVADICATNPNLWNSWRDSLLKELYHATTSVFAKQNQNVESVMQAKQDHARALLQDLHFQNEKIVALWRTFPENYFFRETVNTIVSHTEAILTHQGQYPVVLIKSHFTDSSTEVFIYTPIAEDVFAKSTIIFANLNFNIVEAKIIATLDGFCLATYIILDEHSKKISEQERLQELQANLAHYQQTHIKTPALKQKKSHRPFRHVHLPASIQFSTDDLHNRTIMQVICSDRPGLLASIATALLEQHLHLQNAKIATLGKRVEDVFYINDKEHLAIQDQAVLKQLQFAILSYIDQE